MFKFDGKDKQPAPTGLFSWVGYGCCFMALASICICFVSPYWIQTWAQSENEFKNMGLWHACFKNYMHFKDDSQQKYDGCWWVFDREPKYYKLREWLTPPWFITCQVLTTGCLIILIGVVAVGALVFLHACPLMNHEYMQTYGMFVAGSLMLLVSLIAVAVGLIFGIQMNDRFWLPRPDLNYLSWGFGFLIITSIFSLAGGILLYREAQITYDRLLVKEEEYTKAALEMSTYQLEPLNPPNYDDSMQPTTSASFPQPSAGAYDDKRVLDHPSISAYPSYPTSSQQPDSYKYPGPSSYGSQPSAPSTQPPAAYLPGGYSAPSYALPAFGENKPSLPSYGGKSFQTQLEDGEDFI